MKHDVFATSAVADEAPQPRMAVTWHVEELRSLLDAQPPAIRRNLARCIDAAEASLVQNSPDAASHLRKLHKTAGFVSQMMIDIEKGLPLALRAKALEHALNRPRLVVG